MYVIVTITKNAPRLPVIQEAVTIFSLMLPRSPVEHKRIIRVENMIKRSFRQTKCQKWLINTRLCCDMTKVASTEIIDMTSITYVK